MQILAKPSDIQKNICDFIQKYNNISISVAWASANSEAFKTLIKNKNKIKYSTVGLDFYQTHPDFIKEFLNNENLKFYPQKMDNGIFHPKIYLFWNDEKDWVCLIGSANFTQSALTNNSEIMTMFDSTEGNFKDIKNIIDNYYKKAEIFKKEDFNGYQNVWKYKNKQKKNIDDFKPNIMSKSLYKSSILSLNWNEYYLLLLEKGNKLDERLKLLAKTNEYFKENKFENMIEEQRKNIAGGNKIRDGISDWRLFGRMSISTFLGRLKSTDSELKHISHSLDLIPISGEVTQKLYDDFLYYFKMADKFLKDKDDRYQKAGWGYGISPITRLLSMKRPDEFFCLTSANQKKLIENFGIKKEIKRKDYDRYWNEIIELVRQSPWYNSDKPTDDLKELEAWNTRVALMDALFYNQKI